MWLNDTLYIWDENKDKLIEAEELENQEKERGEKNRGEENRQHKKTK